MREELPFSMASAHGGVRGVLALPAAARALVIIAHAGAGVDERNDALAAVLQHAGMATLTLDLLAQREERFSDLLHNVSLLAKRVLDALGLLKQKALLGELPATPIGLCAAGACTPVVLRVAALRDEDIFAVVCRGGLLDLAGVLYLRSLTAPLLVFAGDADPRSIASNQRALQVVSCRHQFTRLAGNPESPEAAATFEAVARDTAAWFVGNLPPASAARGCNI